MKNINLQDAIELKMDKRSLDEVYLSIISKLKVISETNGKNLNEQEINIAARNLIGLCQEIINYKRKICK